MCTAVTFYPAEHYFGRNLDLECSFNEKVIICPRNYSFQYRCTTGNQAHPALIGIGIIENGYPLYYDAANEHGLSAAGLNFPDNTVYHEQREGFYNIAPFELIPWILCQCKCVADARLLLNNVNLFPERFRGDFPVTPLHWIIADKESAITVESTSSGLMVYDNPIGVLTNSPPFDYQMQNLNNYMNLTSGEAVNRFSSAVPLTPYSRGMGAIGLPGDLSSVSRFVRAAFTKLNSRNFQTESDNVSQFFHILSSVAQCDGCVKIGEHYERTVYSSCCNLDKLVYYYTTYGNRQINAISLYSENLDSDSLISYPFFTEQHIKWINK